MMRLSSVVIAAVGACAWALACAAAGPAQAAPADPSGPAWRERGAEALLELKESYGRAVVLRALGDLGAQRGYEAVAEAAAAAAEPKASTELRSAAAYALGKIKRETARSVNLLLPLAEAEGYADSSQPCLSLRWMSAGAKGAPQQVLDALMPSRKVAPEAWYFCTGIWERRSLDQVLSAKPSFFKLPTITAVVAPHLRLELTRQLLQRLAAARPEERPSLQQALRALVEIDRDAAAALAAARQDKDAKLRGAALAVAAPPFEDDAAAKARWRKVLETASDPRARLPAAAALVARGGVKEALPSIAALYGQPGLHLEPLSQALAEAALDDEVAAALRPAMVAYLGASIDRAPEDRDTFIAAALFSLGPIPKAEALSLLERSYRPGEALGRRDVAALRALAVGLSGGEPAVVTAAHWLTSHPLGRLEPMPPADAERLIGELLELLPATRGGQEGPSLAVDKAHGDALQAGDSPAVQDDARELLLRVLDDTRWTAADEPFLRSLLTLLPSGAPFDELRAAIEHRLAQLGPPPTPLALRIGKWAVGVFGVHFLLWLSLLLTIYPRSRTVQAAMLFNPLGRAVTGWGYTQLLVLASARLRQRLFQPLVGSDADTEVASFDAASFSDRIQLAPIARRKNPQAPDEEGPPVAWTELAGLGGLVVIEGASGLGKTHVLKALLERARQEGRTCLFVRASECNAGVLKEIEARLALDHSSGFVASMIHRGAIELFLDGLNEAQPSGVAEIAQFCERATHARIVLTTQPLTWACPRRARRFRLLPLQPGELEEFLLSQWPSVGAGGEAERAEYAARVRAFLAERDQPRDLEVLQNRIDLAFVAYLLARHEAPNIHSLRKQVVDEAARAYEAAAPGGAFPLAELGAAAVRVLETGHPVLVVDGVDPSVLAHLAERKILLRRGAAEWLFRHDTITCYFAAQGVLAPLLSEESVDPSVISEARLTNPRFFGVYLQLAESLPTAAAEALAAALREQGRASGDRTLEIAYQDVLDRRRG